uniref:Aminomethyltransferase C-terminal domain-containing protein n=1 Tax=Timema cristinae TaxID=61476 RepID=A0A7R9D415_TIMCR|nr:unnamed protein product [Timema cristinae]
MVPVGTGLVFVPLQGLLYEPGPGSSLLREMMSYVTSGGPSPSLGVNIAMGYVQVECSRVGSNLSVKVRDKTVGAAVCKLPFLRPKFYQPGKNIK